MHIGHDGLMVLITAAVRSSEGRGAHRAAGEEGKERRDGRRGGLRRPDLASNAWQQSGVWVLKSYKPTCFQC